MYISYHTIYNISETYKTITGTVQYSSTVTIHRQQDDLEVSGSLYPMPEYIAEDATATMFTSLFSLLVLFKFLNFVAL